MLPVDPVAAEDAATILRQAADAAGYERARQQRATAAATEAWIGPERERDEREGRSLAQGWFELEVDLRHTATEVLLALDSTLHENRRRQTAYDDALDEYRVASAAINRTQTGGYA